MNEILNNLALIRRAQPFFETLCLAGFFIVSKKGMLRLRESTTSTGEPTKGSVGAKLRRDSSSPKSSSRNLSAEFGHKG